MGLLQNVYDVLPFAQDERVRSPKEFRKYTDSFFVFKTFHKSIAISQFIVSHWSSWRNVTSLIQ